MAENRNVKEEEVLAEQEVEQEFELEQDEEITYSEEDGGDGGSDQTLVDRIAQNRNVLYMGIGAVVVIFLAIFGWKTWTDSKNTEANAKAFRAFQYFEQDSLAWALNGKPGTTEPGLMKIISDYGGTNVGNLAKYCAGVALLKQGKTQEGVKQLKSFSKGNNLLSVSAYMSLGFAHEDLNDPQQAASYFEKGASVVDGNKSTTPTMWFHAARNHEAAGNKDKALRLYKQIKEEYPFSTEGIRVDKNIGKLSQ